MPPARASDARGRRPRCGDENAQPTPGPAAAGQNAPENSQTELAQKLLTLLAVEARRWEPVFSLRRLFRLSNQLFQGTVDGLLAGLSDPLALDCALVIDDEKCGGGGKVPLTIDLSVVVERPPADLLPGHHFFEFSRIMRPGIDAQHCEWLCFEIRDERPLV
jgi:hypothetical protein